MQEYLDGELERPAARWLERLRERTRSAGARVLLKQRDADRR
jgi:hypothetical protein